MLTARTLPIPAGGLRATEAERLSRIGRLFIAVLVIVVLEGALRKWVSSSLTLPLVLGRDLIAMLVIFTALSRGLLHRNRRVTLPLLWWSCAVLLWGLLQAVADRSSPLILLLGLRFWLLYLWFAVAAVSAMTEYDYRVAAKTLLWTLLLMTPLVVVQYQSPPSARINAEVDTVDGEVFTAVLGVVRTTGTFSFTAGYSTFMALVAPLVFLMLESPKRRAGQRVLAFLALGGLMIGSIVSGSRGTAILSGGLLVLYLIGNLLLSPGKRKGFVLLSLVTILAILAITLTLFQSAVDTTQQRFEQASEAEDFVGRIMTIFLGEKGFADRLDWLGAGIGQGSNLANYINSDDRTLFALAETETGRTVLEGGWLGYLFVAIKFVIAAIAIPKSALQALRTRRIYPLLIWLVLVLAIFSWSYVGQLSINALFGLLVAFGLLAFKFPHFRLFN